MKKNSKPQTMKTKTTRKQPSPQAVAGLTIGIDLGDKYSHYCVLDEAGVVVESGRLLNNEESVRKHFAGIPAARVALEAGARTHWWTRLLKSFGHEVIVANAREFAQSRTRRKNDPNDAERLARYARLDPRVLRPVTLRCEEQQLDLTRVRVRDGLVRCRTLLVNMVRGVAKEHACRLPAALTASFGVRCLTVLPAVLHAVLQPLLTEIDALTRRIEDADEQLRQLAAERYPETRYLRSVVGVGPLTSLTYVLTLGSAERFAHSRAVGAYLGLRPAQQQSGERDPQLGISKQGNSYLRRLLVQCAHYIVGPFGPPSRLRAWGLALATRGGQNAKKRAVTAVARKLAVLLHRLWRDQQFYQPFFGVDPQQVPAAVA